MNKEHLQILLQRIHVISEKYKATKSKNAFNIFTVIRKGHEEVSLHSKFLFELLSPKGSHHKKDLFLQLFIKELKIDFHLKNATVGIEVENIDLLITNKSQAIIIENKIYAGDQPKQLSRYYKTISNKKINDIYIVYLSLNGKPPSKQSIQEIPSDFFIEIKKRLLSKSYRQFINTWLSNCVKESATEPALRETIIQYQHLLKQLTMSNEVEERIQLLNLLGQGDYMEQASYVVNNWSHMRWHTEMNFWNDLLENKPKNLSNYTLIEEYQFSTTYINGAVHSSRNRDLEYGIALSLFDYGDENICFFIERNNTQIGYGIMVNYSQHKEIKKAYDIKKTSLKEHVINELYDNFVADESSPWIHWKHPKRDINFEQFSSKDTLALANPEKRLLIVTELWEEITNYITTIMQWYTTSAKQV